MGFFGGGGFKAQGPDANLVQIENQRKQLADLQAQVDYQKQMRQTAMQKGPGYQNFDQNEFEKQAGVLPPGYEGVRDVNTGQLIDQFKVNPFTGEASKRLRDEALSTGPSEWAKNALQKQKFDEQQALGKSGLQQQMQQSNAQSQLMRQGGLAGGARTSLARSGARDALMASQNVGAQGIQQRYGINDTDAQRRQQLLGTTADVERQADLANQKTLQDEIQRKAVFDANRYNQQMSAWGAKQAADATRAAGQKSGGGKK